MEYQSSRDRAVNAAAIATKGRGEVWRRKPQARVPHLRRWGEQVVFRVLYDYRFFPAPATLVVAGCAETARGGVVTRWLVVRTVADSAEMQRRH